MSHQKLLSLQKLLGYLFFLPLGSIIYFILIFLMKYKVENLKGIRTYYKNLRRNSNKALLICANHITLIDSVILAWAFGSIPYYLYHYKDISWNIPAQELAKKNIVYYFIAYLGKCIKVNRKGTREHHKGIIEKVVDIIEQKEVVLIFPEGTRTRTGYFELDDIKYGVGDILQKNPHNCQVMAVFLHNSIEHNYDQGPLNYPYRKTHFSISYRIFKPKIDHNGLRGQRNIAMQIANEIKKLENEYFQP